jgi:D-lactate dehydrogenase
MNNSSPYDVYFYEAFEEEAAELKKHADPAWRAGYTWKTIQESGETAPPARLISARTQSILPVEWAGQLAGILSRSTGYDHLQDYREKTGTDAALGYLPLYCNRAVAEQAMLLWMALLRKLPRQVRQFNSFSRDGLTGLECAGKNLLVVGVGHIGYEVVKIGAGLGMEVRGVDLFKRHKELQYIDRNAGVGWADIIVCSMNLTRINRGYFSYELLAGAKPGFILVNIARGELTPMQDLLRALEEERLGGLGLDVYENEGNLAAGLRSERREPSPELALIHKLQAMDNVIFTPHNAFNSAESVVRKSVQSMQQVRQFFASGGFLWNVPEE